jgi:RNA polymerase sigma factor (sigma-70 family)
MRLIGIRPYRCHQCCERFFTGKPKQRQDEPAPVRKEISLAHDLADAHRSTLRGAGARVGGGDEKQGFVPHGQVSCSRICDGSGTRTAVRDVADTKQEGAYQHCLRHEIHEQLAAAIARLPRHEQQVLALYYYEELTMKDVGRLLGVGESRVSQIHSMALLTLRRRLARSHGGTPAPRLHRNA